MTHIALDLFDEAVGDYESTRMRFRISASQLKMFHPDAGGCPRKWALHYLAKVPRLPSLALTDGIRLHECIADHFHLSPEAWAAKWPAFWEPTLSSRDQARVKSAQLALAMIQYTPPGRLPPLSETTDFLEVPELDTAFYIKPDLQRDRRLFVDWKSTSADTKKSPWALQCPSFWPGGLVPEVVFIRNEPQRVHLLKNDIQARLYAHGLMQLWHEVKVTARWVYGSKKFQPGEQPKVWIVEHTFHRPETREWVEQHLWPTVRVMNTIRAAHEQGRLDSALLVPHNGDSCGFTGRFCDALAYCNFKASPVAMNKLRLPVLPQP